MEVITHAVKTHIHDVEGVERVRQRLRIDPGYIRRLRNAFYKKHRSADESLAELPESLRSSFERRVNFHSLTLHSRHDSRLDGASKLVFRTAGGQPIESVVLRIASGRTTLCVSSQVGCAAKCGFCATGQMGFKRDLTHDEILDQVSRANLEIRSEGRSIRNVVFMGMGEPLLNELEVYRSLDILLSKKCFDLCPPRILVSTVGIPDAMVRCAERFPEIGMALSLHCGRQEQREKLIPLARRYPLSRLRDAVEKVTALQHEPLMVECLLLDGINDSDGDLDALIQFIRGLRVHINLIPYNSISDAVGFRPAPVNRHRWFAAALTDAGLRTTVRYSLGSDIAAACGQLVQQA
ncbi:MAG: 23S rRNA (adenine(2503)-C(2))-methyltransferase RlmN [Gemmataceae bacterium]|nr:23S rRNA (adenine(2503)-C(2))-methyltransferase RlmN [Gemmataceae bacterium]